MPPLPWAITTAGTSTIYSLDLWNADFSRYVQVTGDATVLDEQAHYIEGRLVKPDEDSYYDMPGRSPLAESLYQHCVRAIRHGLRFGEHGLPLIGSCDWNDGMDKVGAEGKGESVWLAWFLVDVLRQFATVAERRGDTAEFAFMIAAPSGIFFTSRAARMGF